MALSVQLYLGLLAAVAAGRLIEMARSRRNQAELRRGGSVKSEEPGYKWMVAFHSAVIVGSAVEVLTAGREFRPALGGISLALLACSNVLRWWVIATLGSRWNVEVMSEAPRLGLVTASGPYRWIRHPNYTAVFTEMLALPLVHSAFVVATLGAVAHYFVLRQRVRIEEAVLMKSAAWRAHFERRPRFIPGVV